MSDKTLTCCGQTFVGSDCWRHVYEAHALVREQERKHYPAAHPDCWLRVSGSEFKRPVANGKTGPGVG